MEKYNGMYESVLKLQEAYDTPVETTYKPKKEKWVFMPKFPPTTPKHNRTNRSFEETKQILHELDNDPIWNLYDTGPTLVKKK